MSDEKFRERVIELLESIAKNTEPPSGSRKVLEFLGLVATVVGIFGLVLQVIQFFGGQ